MSTEKDVHENLVEIVEHLQEEIRMILPGIQALFGFQLIAVFNQRFADLSKEDQVLHFVAIICTALAVLLVLTPAAYHRQAEPTKVSSYFCKMGSRVLVAALFPLALGISLDLYILGDLIFNDKGFSMGISSLVFAMLMTAWFIYPQVKKNRAH